MEYESANKAKIQELNDRLHNFGNRVEDDLDGKYSYLHTRINALSEKMHKYSSADDNKLRSLESDIYKIEEELKMDKREFELNYDRKDSELATLEKTLNAEIQELSQETREEKQKITKCIDEKCRTVKQETSDATQQFRDTCANRYSEISQRISQIREVIDNQKKVRSETTEFLIRSFGDQILKLQEVLNAQKNNRIKPNKEASQLIDDISELMVEGIQEERREKERSEELFTRLLEETCFKIQQTFLS